MSTIKKTGRPRGDKNSETQKRLAGRVSTDAKAAADHYLADMKRERPSATIGDVLEEAISVLLRERGISYNSHGGRSGEEAQG